MCELTLMWYAPIGMRFVERPDRHWRHGTRFDTNTMQEFTSAIHCSCNERPQPTSVPVAVCAVNDVVTIPYRHFVCFYFVIYTDKHIFCLVFQRRANLTFSGLFLGTEFHPSLWVFLDTFRAINLLTAQITRSHGSVTMQCCKGDTSSQWERAKLPLSLQPHRLTDIANKDDCIVVWYTQRIYVWTANFFRESRLQNHETTSDNKVKGKSQRIR